MQPYYQDDAVTIYHGDCLDVLAAIGWPAAMRLIVDPPYGFGFYATDIAPDRNLIAKWIGQHVTTAIFGYPESLAGLCAAIGLSPCEWVTWWPTNKGIRRTKLLPRETEHIAIFGNVSGAHRLFRPRSQDAMTRRIAVAQGLSSEHARLGDVWRDPSPGALFNNHLRLHPNEKPLSLMVKLVLLCSDKNDTVIDPFMGSGTTLVAAKQVGRRAIGIEIEERYCEIAARRCAQEVLPLTA